MSEEDPSDRTAVTTRKRAPSPARRSERTSTTDGPLPRRAVDPSVRALARGGRKKRRYRLRKLLGQGGMGEVHLARDERVGRSVALKVVLEDGKTRPDTLWRFLREARVQGQLEHPAIVPVYDIGWDRSGRAYFAMKRISGETLTEVVRELARGNPEYEKKYTTRRLLSLFQQVCLAVHYAHARGVIHRDIKPANIMFGDFGEVYVLDWGIAKVVGADDTESTISLDLPCEESDSTSHGEVLGTVGWMAPEQITDAAAVDARADVYSLGALLFHILTLEPLHGRGSVQERARSTQLGVDARASRRAPRRDIPPELDRVCVKATALEPSERYPSARALHDDVERFLEGDRDTRLRAELAGQHVALAQAAMERALADGPDAAEHRKVAVREAGRALALNPKDASAAAILARLIVEPPKELPAEVENASEALFVAEVQRGARLGAFALLGFATNTIAAALLGVRSPAWLAAIFVPQLFAAALSAFLSRAGMEKLRAGSVPLAVLIALAIAGASGLVGGLLLAPLFALAFAVVATVLHGLGRIRLVLIVLACASWMVPSILEWAGWLPTMYRFESDAVTIFPQALHVPEVPVRIMLFATNFATTVLVCALLWRVGNAISANRKRVQLQVWHLQHLAPVEHADSEHPPAPSPDAPDERTSRG